MKRDWLTQLIEQVRRLTTLVREVKLLLLAIIGFWAVFQLNFIQPVNKPPLLKVQPTVVAAGKCADSVQQVLSLDNYQAADELFFRAHPERDRKMIELWEPLPLKKEWWRYHDLVKHCKAEQRKTVA
jgi:hypothetical protein